MSVGFSLLKKLLLDRQSPSVLHDEGIEEVFFEGKEQDAFNFIQHFYAEYGDIPSYETVGRECSCLDEFSVTIDEPLTFWIDKVKERRKHRLLSRAFDEINSKIRQGDIDGAYDLLGSSYISIRDTFSTNLLTLEQAQEQVIQIHDTRQQESGDFGIPYGFPYVDHISGGAQRGDVIVIAGRPGVGKSYLTTKIADSASKAGFNVLYLSLEMPVVQVARRFLALQAQLDGANLKAGRVSYFGMERAREILQHREDNFGWIKLLESNLYSKVEDVYLTVQEQNPDLLIVDGAYLLRFAGDGKMVRWDRISSVFEKLKHLAMLRSIAILATVQFNKYSPGALEGVAGSDAISQLASVVFSLEYEKPEDKDSTLPTQYRLLRLIKGRDGETGLIRLVFSTHRTRIEQDRVLIGYDDELEREEQETEAEHDPAMFELI